jgi:hypothetical protein
MHGLRLHVEMPWRRSTKGQTIGRVTGEPDCRANNAADNQPVLKKPILRFYRPGGKNEGAVRVRTAIEE